MANHIWSASSTPWDFKEGRVGSATAQSSQIVALSAGDLRGKNSVDLLGQFVVAAHIHGHFVLV